MQIGQGGQYLRQAAVVLVLHMVESKNNCRKTQ